MYYVRYFLLPLFLLLVSAVSFAETSDTEKWTPQDDDLRLLEIRVEKYRLEEVLPAYQRKDYLLVPMGYLSEILDIAINVDIGTV